MFAYVNLVVSKDKLDIINKTLIEYEFHLTLFP